MLAWGVVELHHVYHCPALTGTSKPVLRFIDNGAKLNES
jgi:hypothetical protein